MSPQVEQAPLLEARELHRYLGHDENRVHVLRGVELEIRSAQTYAIAGPSGCGKSTLLYLLGLLDRQDSGEIKIAGELMSAASDAERTQARNRHIGFVFQFHFLLPEFTAAENIMLPMRKRGQLSKEGMRARAHQLLEEVGLADKVNRLAAHLSGGEQQRVAVARALANDPAVLLADEPTGNLDVKNSETVFELLQQFAHEPGRALIMVTHNPELARRADILLEMRDGRFLNS